MAKGKNKIEILVGLPGSGKSYYARQVKLSSKGNIIVVDCDEIRKSYNNLYSPICDSLYQLSYSTSNKRAIIDGLFLTNIDIINLIKKGLKPYLNNSELILIYWKEDRNTCLLNDKGRRNESSTKTIQTSKFEEPDLNLIKSKTGIKDISIVYKTVQLKPDWKAFSDSYNAINGYLYSEQWIIGGYENNYNGKNIPIAPEQAPEFIEFDELLESVYPNVSYLQYKKLYRECVTTQDSEESDYYCGTTYYRKYCCDMEKLYLILQSYGITITPRKYD